MKEINRNKKVPVMEIFDRPTIQGEGMVCGQKTMFVRTGGCDYSCAWCDSAFTWDGSEKAKLMTGKEIWLKMIENGSVPDGKGGYVRNFDHITISGGNPALFNDPIADLMERAHMNGVKVGLETQGSRWQDWFVGVDDLTISPKPPSSGMKTDFEQLDSIITQLDVFAIQNSTEKNYTLKVVVFDDDDFEYAKYINERYQPEVLYLSVGNEDAHQEGSISGRLLNKLDWLWEKVLAEPTMNNARPLPQLHTLVWDNKRGV